MRRAPRKARARAALGAVAALVLAGPTAAAQPARPHATPAPAPPAAAPAPGGGAVHTVAIAPLATLGSESNAADVKAAQKLVVDGVGSLRGVRLIPQASMLDAVKRAGRAELRSCDGDAACLTALGTLVGADYTIYGEVGGLGTAQVVYLKAVDVKAAREVRATVMALGGEHAGPAEAHAAATRLLAPGRYVGTLQVRASIPGASIFIDGELLGRTPARSIALVVGAHALRVTHPESRDFVRFVDVTFEGTTAVDVTLLPYAAIAGDIRRTARDEPVGPRAAPGPTPWYRRWYTVAGGAAILLVGSAIVVGALSGGIDADHEKQLP